MNQESVESPRVGAFLTRRSPKPAMTKQSSTREDLRGQTVKLAAVDDDGQPVFMEMDAADAWKDTQTRLQTYRKLRNWLSMDDE
jgi:hypothetical protein